MSDAVKEQIGDYELLELLGDGAQGKVFKARCMAGPGGPVARDEVVAIKVLRVPPDDERARERFEAQARILKRLNHPHIIRYRDYFTWHPGEWDEAQCLIMEYLEGETLASRLHTMRRGLPWPDLKAIFEQCLSGLIHASREGIIHRDLKPSNIFLSKDGTSRIFDFDIARVEGDSQRSTVGWKGSFDFMSPDFVTEADFHGDEVSDIFSLGTCIYQALTGKLPFEPLGENAHIGYLNRWRSAETLPVLSFSSGPFRVLANAKSFISRSLSAQRDRRYQSFAEMLADFQRIHYRIVQHVGKDTYELHALLGRGGFGEVFQSVRLSDCQAVAIKHLFTERQSTRFIKEAKMLQRYSHPFLVKYIDFIEVHGATRDNQYFLVLELLEGMPHAGLRHRIRQEGKLEPAEAIPLFMNYLEALNFLHGHAHPLVHRDIKPMNLYAPASHPEQAKIFDLGVARDVSGTVTSGGIPGTLDYMAPEFASPDTDRGTPQSDIYALGLCLYEALAGRTVFARLPQDINSAWPMFQERVQNMPLVDYQDRVFRMYPDLMAVVQKAIAPQPSARYQSAAAMRQDLEKVLLRLDHPEEVPVVEEATTIAASALLSPSARVPVPPAVHESGRLAVEDSIGTMLPDLPDIDMAGDARAVMTDRRKRALRAAGVILILILAGAAATVWWSRGIGRMRAAMPVPSVEPVLQPQSQSVPETTPAALPAESESIRTLRMDMDKLARSVRIPIAEVAYAENLSVALGRVRQWGEQYPELSEETGRKTRELEQHARDLPALFKSALDMMLAQKNTRKAEELLAAWQTSSRYASMMGLTPEQASAQEAAMKNIIGRFQMNAAVEEITSLMPSRLAGDPEVEQAEETAEAIEALQGLTWPGVPEAEKLSRIVSLRAALVARMKSGLAAWRDEIVTRYQDGQDSGLRHAALKSLADDAPAALALVSDDYRQVLEAVDAARTGWDHMTRKQRTLLEAIAEGSNKVDPDVWADLPVNRKQCIEVCAAAARVRKGFPVLALLDSEEPARVFIATVADLWKKAALCEGPLGDAIRDSAWTGIHNQLTTQGAILLQPGAMAMAGVRTPQLQARLRREYLSLLNQVEKITGRISVCPEDDSLRIQAIRYFQRPFFHSALLPGPDVADNIPWLAEEFRKAQVGK